MDPWIKQIPAALLEKARVELNEVQDQVQYQIQELRETIEKDPTLNSRTDNAFLLRFLRARKFDQKKALELLKNYLQQRRNYPEFFAKLSTSGIPEALSSNYHCVLPERDKQGRPILAFNSLDRWDPKRFPLEDITANFVLSLEKLIEEDEVQINGVVSIIDAKGLTLSQFPHVTPSALKQFFTLTVNAFPARHKEIHYINVHPVFQVIFMLFKPFLTQKLRNRIIFHGSDLKNFHECLEPRILPEEFGGSAGPFDNTAWNRELAENDESLKQDLAYGLIENNK